MTMAVCYKCGSSKLDALITCLACGNAPRTSIEQATSLALSEHLSTQDQLKKYSLELRYGKSMSLPSGVMTEAMNALNDSNLLVRMGVQMPSLATKNLVPHNQADTLQLSSSEAYSGPHSLKYKISTIHQSPFALLGVTSRDDRRRIVDLAEEKSLELDHDVCQKARSDLTTPRNRLVAEVAWLPGVSPRRASQLLEKLLQDPMSIRKESGLPTLAHLNLQAAALESFDGEHDLSDLAYFIREAAYLAEELNPEAILRDINEDRTVSGFPEVRGVEQIEAELSERKRYYRSAVKEALDKLPSKTLVEIITEIVEMVTEGGEHHAPELIDGLVDAYELDAQEFLQKEAENVIRLVESVRESVGAGEDAVKSCVDSLEAVARNWDKIAQPIQLIAKARGIDHNASRALANEIRSLSIELFNEHDLLAQSQRLTRLLQELFSEVPEVSERLEQDADALAEIFHERKQTAERIEEWKREITYSAEIGLLFKDKLTISPDGILWKGKHIPLGNITRVRWGGVRQSVNGIPTGTNYTIAIGDARSETVVELRRKEVFSKFVDKLWRAVCVRLLGEMLETLKAGRDLQFGDAIVHDDGISLARHRFLRTKEKLRCSWDQVKIWSADGALNVCANDARKTSVAISYIETENTHILEQAIRMAFKKPGLQRLSELME